jgi:hypothetical protein
MTLELKSEISEHLPICYAGAALAILGPVVFMPAITEPRTRGQCQGKTVLTGRLQL